MVELLCDIDDYSDEVNEEFLTKAEEICQEALKMEGFVHQVEISLSLVSNDEIQSINKKFRKKDTKTDVLSFPLNTRTEIVELTKKEKEQYVALGDIIISLEQAKEQAREYNHSLERELLYLVCHSVLHLLGYDHIIDSDKAIMRPKEEVILKKLNITRDY